MSKTFDKSRHLKKCSAALLLIIFSLAITPRIALHNWFAHHKDSNGHLPADNRQQLSTAGFNCNCENLVAESHFATFSITLLFGVRLVHYSYFQRITPSATVSLDLQHLRGPPFEF